MKRIKRRFYPAFIIAKAGFQIDADLRHAKPYSYQVLGTNLKTSKFLFNFRTVLLVISLYTAYAFMPIEEFSSGDIFVVQAFIGDLNWQFTMLFWSVFMLFETSISIKVSMISIITQSRSYI